MITFIDGGFQVAVKDLLTMDLSWLFMFCSLVTANCLMFVSKVCNKIKRKK